MDRYRSIIFRPISRPCMLEVKIVEEKENMKTCSMIIHDFIMDNVLKNLTHIYFMSLFLSARIRSRCEYSRLKMIYEGVSGHSECLEVLTCFLGGNLNEYFRRFRVVWGGFGCLADFSI